MSNESNKPIASAAIEQDGKYLKLRLWNCRALYANVNEPRIKDGKPIGFDCEFLLPKDAEGAENVIKTIRAAGAKRFPGRKWKSAVIHDPDREMATMKEDGVVISEALAMKAGHWVIKANTGLAKPPKVRGVVYSGCYAGAVLAVCDYETTDQNNAPVFGVKAYLNGVAWMADGERLGGGNVNLDEELGLPPERPSQPSLPGDDDFSYQGGQSAANGTDDDIPF